MGPTDGNLAPTKVDLAFPGALYGADGALRYTKVAQGVRGRKEVWEVYIIGLSSVDEVPKKGG